jgi:RHS repeat-associated protein
VTAAASDGSYAGAQMSWSYDPFGNRTSESVGGSSSAPMPLPSTASYTASNQVSSVNGGAGLAYDAAGDVTQDPLNSYLYDAEGRLCAAKTAGPSYTGYIYDAGGTRVAKGSLTNFTCDFNPSDSAYNHFAATASYVLGPSGEQVTEYSTSGLTNTGTQCTSTTATCWKHTNAFAVGQLLATYTGTDTIFALKDWLGSKRVEVGASGCATAFSGLAYGDGLTPVSLPGYASCIDATEQHFTGKERDAESGNDYFEARYYSSTMGRFMSPDWSAKIEPVPYAKMGDPQSLNLYAYVQNHPLSATDPDGHIENSWWQNASATYDPLASRWAAQQALQINTLILQQELAKLQNEVSNGGLGLSDKAVKLVEHIANIKTTIDSAKWYAYWNKLYTGHLYMYRFDGGSSRYADPGRIPLDLAHMKLDEAEMSYYGAKQVLEAGQVFGKMTPGMVESCLVVQRMQVHQAEYEYEQAFSEYTQTPVRQ